MSKLLRRELADLERLQADLRSVDEQEALGRAEQEGLRHAVRIPPVRRSPRREAVFITLMLAEGDTGRTVYAIWRGAYKCRRGAWSADFNKGETIEHVESRRGAAQATGSLAPFPLHVVERAEAVARRQGLPLAHRDDLCAVGRTA